jgi:hypothetical protein
MVWRRVTGNYKSWLARRQELTEQIPNGYGLGALGHVHARFQ